MRSLSMNRRPICPVYCILYNNGRVSPRVLWPGHCDMVMARLLLMLCLGPAEGKVQGREEPPRQWLVTGKINKVVLVSDTGRWLSRE